MRSNYFEMLILMRMPGLIAMLFSFYIVPTFAQQMNNIDSARMGSKNLGHVILPYNEPEADTTGMTREATQGNGALTTNGLIITDWNDWQVQPNQYCQTEPHLTINKNHPNNIIISANHAKWVWPSPNATFSQSIFYNLEYNNIGSWQGFISYPHTNNTSWDPSTAVDADGNLYVSAHSDDLQSILIERSSIPQQGAVWATPVNIVAGTSTLDKGMIVSDNLPEDPGNPLSPMVNRIYSVWTNMTSPYPVQFGYSDDGGQTFSTPIDLSSRWGAGAHVQTGPNHEVYVCWADYYPYSTPGHALAYPPKNIAFVRKIGAGSFSAPTYIQLDDPLTPEFGNGGIQWGNGPLSHLNYTRANDFPVLAVDRSCNASSRGNIYMTYAANDPSNTNGIGSFRSRIFVVYSTDNGATWQPCNTNGIVDDGGLQNWLPWMAVDNATGNIYVAYLKKTSSSPFECCVFMAYSDDQGATFNNIQVSDQCYEITALPEIIDDPTVPGSPYPGPFPGGYAGDYIAIDAYAGNIYVAWPQNTNSLPYHYNIMCSKLTASTPALISAGENVDLNLNGIVEISAPPHSPNAIHFEGYNHINVAMDQERFVINNGGIATFQAGNSIHFIPGSNNTNDFGSLNGSLTHAFILPVEGCTIPFRYSSSKSKSDSKTEVNSESNIIISPNPFLTDFKINYSVIKNEELKIELLNSFGVRIKTISKFVKYIEDGQYMLSVNMEGLQPGIYYLLFSSEIQHVVKKIIKL